MIYILQQLISSTVSCGILCGEQLNYLNMKFLILSVCVAMVAADVSHILPKQGKDESQAKIVKQALDVGVEGQYEWQIETENGIQAGERGALKNAGSENAAEEVQGQVSWTSPEGEPVQFQYIANENGYQPQGSHIPTPPPIPDYILRSLQYIKDHPHQEEKN